MSVSSINTPQRANLIGLRLPLLLWLLSGPLIVSLAFGGPIERTQEARVLETAREMIGQGWRNWLIPHCNGQVRLRKPPLPYWAAAASFEIFGVHDWAGRIPFALASWLMLGATYAAARPIIGRRGAFLASAGLAGTYFFTRFARCAETDVLAAPFVTASIAAIIHAALARQLRQRMLLFLAAGVCIGLSVMSKGPPAVFPVLFLIGCAAILRGWRIIREFLLGGLPAACAIALPWWIYVAQLPEFKSVGNEIKKVALGLDHPGPPWFYFLVMFVAAAPWCAFAGMGMIDSISRFRRDLRAKILLLWIGCIIIPMSLVGKKQDHYMLPLLPPLMAAAAWYIEQGLRGRLQALRLNRILLIATAIGCILGSAVPIFTAHQIRQKILPIDCILALLILAGGLFLLIAVLRNSGQVVRLRAFLATFVIGAILMVITMGYWRPALETLDYPDAARQIEKQFGHRELALYEDENLPICFYLARTLPYYATREELLQALARRPQLLLIWEQQRSDELPPPGKEIARVDMRKRDLVIYEQE